MPPVSDRGDGLAEGGFLPRGDQATEGPGGDVGQPSESRTHGARDCGLDVVNEIATGLLRAVQHRLGGAGEPHAGQARMSLTLH